MVAETYDVDGSISDIIFNLAFRCENETLLYKIAPEY